MTNVNWQNYVPALPHAFYGTAYDRDGVTPVPSGVQVLGVCDGVYTGVAGNPVITQANGVYGTAWCFGQKLVLQGQIAPDAPITFFVNGYRCECRQPGGKWQATWPYEAGGVTALDLRIVES